MDELVRSIDSFPICASNNFKDECLKKNLAFPYDYFDIGNFQEPLNLTKEDFWSTTPNQEIPPDEEEESNRTQEIIKKFNIKNGQEVTMLYLEMDVLQLTDVFENFVEKSTLRYFWYQSTILILSSWIYMESRLECD